MEVRLSSSATAWSCKISLRIENGSTLSSDDAATITHTTKPFGPILDDKAQVEIWLRRAQAAILAPHRDHATLYKMTREQLRVLYDADERMLQFSRDVIVLEVWDPEATNLSFVDLPGSGHLLGIMCH
jgi:vacuolar protein sorting-associated protein 1